jgi:hypothetical protein
MWQWDRGVEILDEEFRASGIDFEALPYISTRAIMLTASDDPVTTVLRAYPDVMRVGREHVAGYLVLPRLIVLRPYDCPADGAFLHELTHVVLCRSDCDYFHDRQDVWAAVGRANIAWGQEICG